jgi:hypothetical protein
MPQLKQPMTLKDKSLQECVNLYCGTCESWISKLRQAQATSRLAYWNMRWSVLAECRQIERTLSQCSDSVIKMMSPQLTIKFAWMIEGFDRRFWNGGRHSSLCIAMFRSVLTHYFYKYDDLLMCLVSIENLIIQTLDSVPGLGTLHLKLPMLEDGSAQPARMIYHLRHLQEFTYVFHCIGARGSVVG